MLRNRLMRAAAKKRAAGGGGDPYFSNVVLLSNYTADASDVKGHTMVLNLSASVSAGQLQLPSTGYVRTDDSPDWTIAGGNFSIDALLTLTGTHATSTTAVITQTTESNNTNSAFGFGLSSSTGSTSTRNRVTFWCFSGGTYSEFHSTVSDIPFNAEHHIEVCRSGTTLYFFVDGVARGTGNIGSTNINDSTNQLYIGGQNSVAFPHYMVGKINAIRFTKGIARHTSGFTPPTSPFPEA